MKSMVNRFVTILYTGIILTCLFPLAAFATTASWEIIEFDPCAILLKQNSAGGRIQGRTGPDNTYTGGGSYQENGLESIEALYVEKIGGGSWVYVEIHYNKPSYFRRLYFRSANFQDLDDIPYMTFEGVNAKLTQSVTPRFGPGKHYDAYDDAYLPRNTRLTVLFEENDYLFVEFAIKAGTGRAWVSKDVVELR